MSNRIVLPFVPLPSKTYTQLAITKFFKPRRSSESEKAHRKEILAKQAKLAPASKPSAKKPKKAKATVSTAPKPAPKPAKAPKKLTSASKQKLKELVQTAHESKRTPPSQPKSPKPKPTTATTPNSTEHITAALDKSVSPRFKFESAPTFAQLFPGTNIPKGTMQDGLRVIKRTTFNSLLAKRVKSAHSVLRNAKITVTKLPKTFIRRLIHQIQQSLNPKKKSAKKDARSKASLLLVPTGKAKAQAETLIKEKPHMAYLPSDTQGFSPEQLQAHNEENDHHQALRDIRNLRTSIMRSKFDHSLLTRPNDLTSLTPIIVQVMTFAKLTVFHVNHPSDITQSIYLEIDPSGPSGFRRMPVRISNDLHAPIHDKLVEIISVFSSL